jgi:Putative peptidoglycan binding domain
MSRRGVALGAAGLVVAGTGVAAALGLSGRAGTGPAPAARERHTAPVVRQTLVDSVTVSGRPGFGTAVPVRSDAAGTVTWLPAVGTTVGRGGQLLRVDDQPVVLLYGRLPMYRALTAGPPAAPGHAGGSHVDSPAAGVSTVDSGGPAGGTDSAAPAGGTGGGGPAGGTDSAAPAGGTGGGGPAGGTAGSVGNDVAQLEANLWALGYRGFTVDRAYTAATAAAVRHWQHDLGLPETGQVGRDQVSYAAGPVRVAGWLARVGGPAAGDVLSTTGTSAAVECAVDADKAGWAVPGARVTVALPGGRTVPGTVTAAAPAQPAADAEAGPARDTVQVTVAVADQRALRAAGPVDIDVTYAAATRRDVLTVPVDALLALAEGGYGVEVDDGTSTRVVAVRTGLFATGRVEVSGPDLRPGLSVRVPQ